MSMKSDFERDCRRAVALVFLKVAVVFAAILFILYLTAGWEW